MLVIFEDDTTAEINSFDEIECLPATGIYPTYAGKLIKSVDGMSADLIAQMIIIKAFAKLREKSFVEWIRKEWIKDE